jgi:hypothetical protein
VARKKSVTKIVIPIIYFLVGIIGVGIIFFHLRQLAFTQCVEHKDNSPTHTHAQLKITQDGIDVPIPANIGITSKCMHPLHTHDGTGLIHMEYPIPFPFFLGDFFDIMGTTFNDSQIGAIRMYDEYKITVIKNNKRVPFFYRWILLKDLDKIEIKIEKKK